MIRKGETSMSQTEQRLWDVDPAVALERLMAEYGTKVLHLAFFYLKDRHLAEDVAQEVFLKAYHNWHSFRGESAVYTWLYRITVNLCRDKARTAWWRRLIPVADPRGSEEAREWEQVSPEGTPEEVLVASEERAHLLRHVQALPEHYREVLLLYYYQDLSTVEIAEVLNANENTVKTRLFRARQLLKESLAKGGSER
jgi:RNA polymerase sigma-70 factor (ECF subfamily)